MAQRTFSIDLSKADFPLMSANQGRTVINSERGEVPNAPAIAYCHNVMPTEYGYKSVGFETKINPANINDIADTVRIVQGSLGSRIYIMFDSVRRMYYLLPSATTWVQANVTVPPTTVAASFLNSNDITVATINGVSYIMFYKIGLFWFDEGTNTVAPRGTTGLTIGNVVGMVASSGYLIAYTEKDIAWSSTLNPLDFVPSQVTGAGGASIQDIKGNILFCAPTNVGFLIYTTANVVAATYTGNAQFPWKFREVPNASGGLSLDETTHEATAADQFVRTKAGMQIINSNRAEGILPELTDFLDGSVYEILSSPTANAYTYIGTLGSTPELRKKISFIGSRYLVISYGFLNYSSSRTFSYALIYDSVLKKLGKVRIEHVASFEYFDGQDNITKKSVAFVGTNGTVSLLDFATTDSVPLHSGLLVLGKLQHSRVRLLTLHEIETENHYPTAGPSNLLQVYNQVSLDGSKFVTEASASSPSPDYVSGEAGNYRNVAKYSFRSIGKNHSIVLSGQFNLSTVLATYNIAGRR